MYFNPYITLNGKWHLWHLIWLDLNIIICFPRRKKALEYKLGYIYVRWINSKLENKLEMCQSAKKKHLYNFF